MNEYHRDEYQEEGNTLSLTKATDDEPCVYIVLLNWNGWRDTLECMHSLSRTEYPNWRAVIVDNGSTDDSPNHLREAYPGVPVIENGENLGFAAGNNTGIRFALKDRADYVFVLNNDTTVFPDTLSQLVGFAVKHPEAALMSPRIHRRDPQREWPIRRRLDLLTLLCVFTPLRRIVTQLPIIRTWFYYIGDEPSLVNFLPGSALFFRAATFGAAGYFDECTFLDFEELIIAERVRSAGLSLYIVPQAGIQHKGSASGSKLQAKRYIENARSEEYFLSTYVSLSRVGRWLIRSIRFTTFTLRALRHKNYREHFGEFVEVLASNRSSNLK